MPIFNHRLFSVMRVLLVAVISVIITTNVSMAIVSGGGITDRPVLGNCLSDSDCGTGMQCVLGICQIASSTCIEGATSTETSYPATGYIKYTTLKCVGGVMTSTGVSYYCDTDAGYGLDPAYSSVTCTINNRCTGCTVSCSCSSVGYSGSCSGTDYSTCYTSCSKACNPIACPSGYSCTYNSSYTYGTQYYGSSTCDAQISFCTIAKQTCNTLCSAVSNTSSTQPCTRSCSVTGGTCYYSGSIQTCNGKYTNSNCYSAGESCSGCSLWGTCGGGTRYITCPAGTYWNGSSCTSCGTGYYCPGFSNVADTSLSNGYGRSPCTNKPNNSEYSGSATSNSCPWSCNAGYYGSSANGDTSCANCGSGYYCTGGTHRASCASTVPSSSPSASAAYSLNDWSWSGYQNCPSADLCVCDWYLSDSTRWQYLNQSQCMYGPSGNNYTHYDWCRTGYYASDPLNFSSWYNSCTACTNKPANSYYTSYSTPSTMYAVESNCPWCCDAGYYQSGSSCASCTGVSYVDSGTDTETITGGSRTRSKSRTCYHSTSSACSTSSSACTGTSSCGDWSYGDWVVTCSEGYYLSSGTCKQCEAEYYCPGDNSRYGCSSGYTSAAGAASCSPITVNCPAGQFMWWWGGYTYCVDCHPGYYCPGGTNIYGSGHVGSANSAGVVPIYSCPSGYTANTTYGKSAASQCQIAVAAGQYLTTQNGTTTENCTSGTYKAAHNVNYGSTDSCTSCPSPSVSGSIYVYFHGGSALSPTGATAATQCYLDTNVADYWTHNVSYRGFYRCRGRQYYSSSTGYYSNCDEKKYFSECNAGYFIDYSVAMNSEFSNSCTICGAGTYTEKYSTASDIGDGSYHYQTSCTACPGGTYNPNTGSTSSSACLSCPSGYPNSGAGSDAASDCNTSCTKACTQSGCPTGYSCTYNSSSTSGTQYYGGSCNAAASTCEIATQTCNTLCSAVSNTTSTQSCTRSCSITNGTCSYNGSTQTCNGKYTNSACQSAGESCSGCSSWGTCDGGTISITCNAGYYLSNGACKQCESGYYCTGDNNRTTCPSGYGSSAAGSTKEGDCYTTVTRGCTQNNGDIPSGCASVTEWNACSCTGGTYVKYANGSTSGTTTNEECPKTPKTVTANANRYVSGTTCPACPTAYPSSDGGSISDAYCYESKTNTGSQLSCSQPENSESYTCGTCNPGTCNWRDYKSATDTSCTPTDCNQPVNPGSVVCNTGYYTSGTTCPACTNAPSNSSYTGTATSNDCPWECNDGYNLTSDNQCARYCMAGVTHIHLGTGLKIPLYSSKRTTPSINVRHNGTVCYADLIEGESTGLHVKYNGKTYHAAE